RSPLPLTEPVPLVVVPVTLPTAPLAVPLTPPVAPPRGPATAGRASAPKNAVERRRFRSFITILRFCCRRRQRSVRTTKRGRTQSFAIQATIFTVPARELWGYCAAAYARSEVTDGALRLL